MRLSDFVAMHLFELSRLFTAEARSKERLVDVAKNNNCVNLQWQTPVFNEMAIRFYERIGGKAHDKKRFLIFT